MKICLYVNLLRPSYVESATVLQFRRHHKATFTELTVELVIDYFTVKMLINVCIV